MAGTAGFAHEDCAPVPSMVKSWSTIWERAAFQPGWRSSVGWACAQAANASSIPSRASMKRYIGVTCGLVVPSLRGAVCTPLRSVSPALSAGSTRTRTACARTWTPVRGAGGGARPRLRGPCALQCCTVVAWMMGTVSCKVWKRSVFVSTSTSSGSYVTAPSCEHQRAFVCESDGSHSVVGSCASAQCTSSVSKRSTKSSACPWSSNAAASGWTSCAKPNSSSGKMNPGSRPRMVSAKLEHVRRLSTVPSLSVNGVGLHTVVATGSRMPVRKFDVVIVFGLVSPPGFGLPGSPVKGVSK